jgi:hypothetical protein
MILVGALGRSAQQEEPAVKLHFLALVAAALAIVVTVPQLAPAQGVGGGFYMGSADNPNGPTVSPYLNLLQSNTFGVTNYQSLVKPLIEQSSAIRRQGRAINQVQQQLYSGPNYGASPSGRGSHFMFYSHFYPGMR